jgi:hypothetical protein
MVLIPVLLLSACGPPREYAPVTLAYQHSVKPLSGGQPIAVYLLRDVRDRQVPGFHGTAIGFVVQNAFQGKGVRLYADEPVEVSATHALVEGLKARGVLVVDRTRRLFEVGDEANNARLALLGDIQKLGFPDGGDVSCALRLELREIHTGEKLWEKSFSSQVARGPSMVGAEGRSAAYAVNEALSLAIDDALMDQEFTNLITKH